MPDHLAIAVCKALETLLDDASATGTFGYRFDAVRAYKPRFDLDKDNDLKVTVVAATDAAELLTRGLNWRTIGVSVAVQQRVNPDDPATIDPLMALVTQIQTVLSVPLDDLGATWIGWKNEPIYRPDHLLENKVFTSITTFTYKLRAAR